MDREQYSDADIMWKVIIHLVFIASAVVLALLDRITAHTKTLPPRKDEAH
jgi:uncharacterized protein (TIGR00645 family)